MKPIRLTMQAFGPFSQSETIDFNVLGDNPLFLIHGQTGAGKSTILDAMCFALYGQAADAVRETSNLRCDRAAPDLHCQVEFEFAIGDKTYRITRKPAQLLPGRTSDVAAKATLVQLLADGSEHLLVERKITEANEAIASITGLQVEQFRQVMVLPQGKFRELLLAKSDEREKILADLFQTDIYKRIEDELKLRAADITRAKQNQNEQIKGILNAAEQANEADLHQQIEQQKPELAALEQQAKQSDDLLKQHDLALHQAREVVKQFEQLESMADRELVLLQDKANRQAQEAQVNLHVQAQKVSPYMQELTGLEQDQVQAGQLIQQTQAWAEQLQQASSYVEEQYNKAQAVMQTKPQWDIRLNQLNSLKDQFNKIEAQQTELKQLEQGKRKQAELLTTLSAQLAQQEQAQTAAQQAKHESLLLDKEILELELELKQIIEQGKKARDFDNLQKDALALKKQAETKRHAQDKSQRQLESLKQTALHLELNWHQGQAALLAKQLQAGEACPVCGSVEHPHIAYSDNVVLVEQHQVEQARHAQEQAHQVWQEDKEQWQQLLTQSQAKQLEIDKWRADNATIASVDEWLLKHKQQDAVLKAKQLRKQDLQKQIETIETIAQAIKTYLEQQEQVRQSLSILERNEGVAKEKLSQLQQALPAETQTQAQLLQAIADCQQQIQLIEQGLQQAQAAKQKHAHDVSSAKTQLSERQEKAQALATVIQTKSLALASMLSQTGFATREQCGQALLSEYEAKQIQTALDAYKQELTRVESQKKLLQEQVSGKTKPDLSTLQETLVATQATHQRINQVLEDKRLLLRGLQASAKSLEQIKQRQVELDKQYQILGTMSEVANGRNSAYISLQRFVLSVILEEVLENASHRLQYLSDGRYDLVRRQEVKRRGTKSGLDIDVFDVYSGQTREASTLSGGESFLASLSLALGLSDVVQQRSGGIKLDTLFIDEGFGSLDQGALDLAINSLLELRNSGRMIGIISHVSELKEQIHLGVEVKSNPSGSHVVIHGVS